MTDRRTLADLARRVGCEKWPERWNEFFHQVMEDFDQNGCIYTREEYYDGLNQKYGMLSKDLSVYKEAAREVAKDEDLSRFLAVLCRALQDREYHKSDLREFSQPQKPGSLAYEMLTALAVASQARMCYELLAKRNLPKKYLDAVMTLPEKGIDSYRNRHGGRPGYSLLDWYQLAIDGKLFPINRLEFEIHTNFIGRVCVFENEEGERVALACELTLHRDGVALGSIHFEEEEGSFRAMISESDTAWEGNPVNGRGLVENRTVHLEKKRWKKILSFGDPMVGIHIPAKKGLDPQLVEESIQEAKVFLKTYFPDYSYRGFSCDSWLMDPQLVDLLGEEANISKFCNRFSRVTGKSQGQGVLGFVFLKTDFNCDLTELPENTRLERALKKHYLDGKAIYEMRGYFFE